MIAYLAGCILEKSATRLVLDVQGVGYLLAIPSSTYFTLPEVGQSYRCLVHTAVREDAITLYGFDSQSQRSLFQALIKVNGIGPKVALGILSSVSVEAFTLMVRERAITKLVKLPGIGKKTAERLMLDMQQFAVDAEQTLDLVDATQATTISSARDHALEALLALGYSTKQAQQTLQEVQQDDLSTDQLIRTCLRVLSPN